MNQIRQWADRFHTDGFLVVPSVLSPDECFQLKADLDKAYGEKHKRKGIIKRMFERSKANLELFGRSLLFRLQTFS